MVMAETRRPSNAFANAILCRLSSQCIMGFGRNLQPIALELKQNIYLPNEPIRHAYFPEVGMLSVVSTMDDGRSIEVGTIGNEGMTGASLLHDTDTLPYHCYVQIAGHGHRIDAAVLKNTAMQDDNLRELISRYQSAFLIQSMQSAACNGLHSITQRCCRWILTSLDRVQSNVIPLTLEF